MYVACPSIAARQSPAPRSGTRRRSEFSAELLLPRQSVSYHPKQLVEAGVIARERRGRYSLFHLGIVALD